MAGRKTETRLTKTPEKKVWIMVTQTQIAKIAGVSRATVERVINNRGDVNDETRKRVLKIIEEMEYRPNRAGKTLAIKQRNLKIGCIIIQADNPFYEELNKGILEAADEFKAYGIDVIIETAVFTAKAQISKINELLEMGISGLLIQPTIEPGLADVLREVEARNIPIVTVNTDLLDYTSSLCYVGNDFHLCGKTAANLMQLLTGSACKTGIVTGFFNARSHADRISGFKDYIADYPDMEIVDIRENQDDEMESYYITRTMLEAHPEIDAIFLVAGGVKGACRAIRQQQEKTGRKIRTISFDDVPTTKELVRDGTILATICQQPVRQGRMALTILFDYLIDGKMPASSRMYTDIQIKLKTNIDA